ncbi:hypothetical protein IGI43_002416 [Enterococcus sp. AZ126]
MDGWDSKIQSCIPTSLIINPLDNPETLEKTIIEILSSAVKESSKISGSKINALTDSLNKTLLKKFKRR